MTGTPFPRDPEAPDTPGDRPPATDHSRAPAPGTEPPRPVYTPGSAQPRLNRPVHERYPQIRPTSGYGTRGSATPDPAPAPVASRSPSARRS